MEGGRQTDRETDRQTDRHRGLLLKAAREREASICMYVCVHICGFKLLDGRGREKPSVLSEDVQGA